MMLEYWVEHYHQVAHRYDMYWRGMTDIQRQAEIRARMENRFRDSKTKEEKAKVVARFVGVLRKRKRLEKNVGKDEKVKLEREEAVTKIMEKLANTTIIGAMGDFVDRI